ncbi:dipeptidase [Portibacter marinus]|uniref:dipeptidase n=1 Tax=Portibacter marinus TaxID=2898660 RepID=UPI001F222DC7|nr:membrane dipeptidase [Portibacter marinus]
MKRRPFLKAVSLSALAPIPIIKGVTQTQWSRMSEYAYDESIVIDGLIITRNWDEASFEALEQTGYSGFNASLDSATMQRALLSLSEWQERIKSNPEKLLLATASRHFRQAKSEGKTAVLLGFQNSRMIDNDLENLDILYTAGTRWMQLTYNERNLIGDGCTERTNAGLSDYGIQVVERMNELGIVIDLSHCGRQTTDDGIKFSKYGAMINHSMCEALHQNHPRAKTDRQIKAMADKGGVIGIISLGYMIGPKIGVETTLDTYVNHIKHAVKVGGIDHVGLAADFAIQGLQASGATRENWYVPRLTRFKPSYKVQWPPWIPELDSTDRYRLVAERLQSSGFKPGEIDKILGLNWIRYYEGILDD